MESLPRPKPIELCGVANASPRPARETLEALMRFKVACLVAMRRAYRSVYSMEPELFFEDVRKRLVGVDGLVGVMDLQRLRVNLVHRNMDVLVLLFTVADRNVLVFSEPRRPHGAANDILELRRAQAPVLWVKRDDEMIRLASLGPQIAFLEQLHDGNRKLGVLASIEAL